MTSSVGVEQEWSSPSSRWGTTEYLLIIATSAVVYALIKRKSRNLPPGPTPLPIIGNLHQVKNSLHETFDGLRKQYGDVFTFYLGGFRAVVLNNPKVIREGYNESAFSGRPIEMPFITERNGPVPRGVLLSHENVWLEQRRFTLKTLRDFGFGKKSMESLVLEEVNDLIESFSKSAGKPIQTQNKFNAAVLNALWQLVTGQRYSHDDPVLLKLIKELTSAIGGSPAQALKGFSPLLWTLMETIPKMITGKKDSKRLIREFVEKEVKDHISAFDPEAPPTDFIDVYLKARQGGGVGASFEGEKGIDNLVVTLIDLFVAGSETTSTTLSWLFLLMALNPEKQKKLHDEIQEVVGRTRNVSLTDGPEMPYTEATILEVLRYSAMVPQGVFHAALKDTMFKGYLIPKGTLVVSNLYACMRDTEIWGDPDNFRPERFLSPDGKSVLRNDALLAFSVGKRVCLGETLARDELFLFTTNLLQRFRITPDTNGPPLKVDYYTATVLIPKPHDLILHDRYEE